MKLNEVTPKEYMCGNCGCGCPAIFATDRGTYVIIGKKTDFTVVNDLSETVIVVDKAMINGAK